MGPQPCGPGDTKRGVRPVLVARLSLYLSLIARSGPSRSGPQNALREPLSLRFGGGIRTAVGHAEVRDAAVERTSIAQYDGISLPVQRVSVGNR